MNKWSIDAVFYHIYPLGFCGAPKINDFTSEPVPRLDKIYEWIEHIKFLGADSIYFGPVFESGTHGYDTADYRLIDRRLGNNADFKKLVQTLHANNIRVVIDAVFNHTGRDFFAFKDLIANGPESEYCSWFSNLNFNKKSPCNDPFDYETWSGHYRLVKLNTGNIDAGQYLFDTVRYWIDEFDIDGLRLDCADCLEFNFIRELALLCKEIKPEFWLMGEVIHGDYRKWVNNELLDSVTNYVCYKGLYSSLNDKNYFEIAHSLNLQFGEKSGIYNKLNLYNFADNHDVNRIASTLKHSAYLYPLHLLLFTMPGIPSIYYGSEWGIAGLKDGADYDLRPELDLNTVSNNSPNKDLAKAVAKLSCIRKGSEALKSGNYLQIAVRSEQFAFMRMTKDEWIAVVLNSSDNRSEMEIELPVEGTSVIDILNNDEIIGIKNRKNLELNLYPCWGRILKIVK